MRLGIFGGSFDPPHVGHLLAASDAFEMLELDQLLFVPAGVQPLKAGRAGASGPQRLEMLRALIGEDRRFAADPIEIEREGLSFTVETLEQLAERQPSARRFLLIGEELTAQLPSWRDPERIAALADIVAMSRAGGTAAAQPAPGSPRITVRRVETRRVDVSSTEIRARIRTGLPIHGFVPNAVAELIESAALYR